MVKLFDVLFVIKHEPETKNKLGTDNSRVLKSLTKSLVGSSNRIIMAPFQPALPRPVPSSASPA